MVHSTLPGSDFAAKNPAWIRERERETKAVEQEDLQFKAIFLCGTAVKCLFADEDAVPSLFVRSCLRI